MWNVSLAFRVLTWSLSKAHPYILNFEKPMEKSTNRKRLKYTKFINLPRFPKCSVDMNSYWLERTEIRVLILDYKCDIGWTYDYTEYI